MVAEETDSQNAFETTLTAEMGPTDLTAAVVSKGLLATPAMLVIEPDSDTQREVIRFNGTFGGSSFVTQSTSFRYLEGSAAPSGLTHPSGSIVRSTPLTQHFEDLHDRIDADIAAHTKAAHDALLIDADTLDGIDGAGFTLIAHDGGGGAAHADVVAGGADGFMTGADKTILDAHVGAGGAAHADVVAGGADGFMTGADKTILDAVATPSWTTWVPTYTNFTPGNGTLTYARYWQHGKLVVARFRFLLGSSSSVGTDPQISLPVNAHTSHTTGRDYGNFAVFQDGATRYPGNCLISETTQRFFLRAWNASGTYLTEDIVSATIPFTFGSGDEIIFGAVYEAA